ncbi:hypothetical protein DFQ27_002101, partial [Actinomortierella ambigua]
MLYQDKDNVCLSGRQLSERKDPRRHPIKSALESHKGNRGEGKWREAWEDHERQGLTLEDVEGRMALAKQHVDQLKKKLEPLRKTTAMLRKRATISVRALHANKDSSQRDELFGAMKSNQRVARDADDSLARTQA